jgi:guanylate kinase
MKEILCIVGESGSGKTLAQEYINREYNIPLIESYTTRPKRSDDEQGHKFVSDVYFNSVKEEDIIAYTKFGDYHYWCEKKDVQSKNIYVIDEDGLRMLKERFRDEYIIYSLKINSSNKEKLLRGISPERLSRDHGRFLMPDKDFDFVINNNHSVFYFMDSLMAVVHEIGFNHVV